MATHEALVSSSVCCFHVPPCLVASPLCFQQLQGCKQHGWPHDTEPPHATKQSQATERQM